MHTESDEPERSPIQAIQDSMNNQPLKPMSKTNADIRDSGLTPKCLPKALKRKRLYANVMTQEIGDTAEKGKRNTNNHKKSYIWKGCQEKSAR